MSLKLTRMVGGGESWWYAVNESGRVVGASHEDNKEEMAHLRKLVEDSDSPSHDHFDDVVDGP
jgi:hypothetical protein